jgi:NAD(P)-dependent dehydrogenase (short-subunit alcohol dehydrogenase family)
MDFMLQGKIAMVAASSRGLGFGVARELALFGYLVPKTSASEYESAPTPARQSSPASASECESAENH